MLVTKDGKKNILFFLVLIALTLTYVFLMYFLTKWNLSDIFILPSALWLGYLSLRFVARTGIFDVFSYQIINWTSSWKKGIPKKYQDAYEYKVHIKEERSNHKVTWIPFLAIGGICLILCVIFSFFPGLGR